jgi:hypothetical protein
MRQALLFAVICAVGLAVVGCQPASVAYRYRAGSWYEYEQLAGAWIPNNGTLPPLPPVSESVEGGWVEVPASGGKVVSYSNYHWEPSMYIGGCFGDRPGGRLYHRSSLWGPRWRRHGSGLSIGFSFGSPGYWPGHRWHSRW